MRASTVVLSALVVLSGVTPCEGQPPLTARITVSLAQAGGEPKVLSNGFLYYDSQGRIRQELTNFDANREAGGTIVTITDPVAGRFYRLYPDERTAEVGYFRAPLPSDPLPGEPGSPFPEGSFVVRPSAELGTQLIEGRSCNGTAYGESPVFNWAVVWRDQETGLDLLRVEARKDGRLLKTLVSEIQLGEPNPNLFSLPSDYTVRQAGR